MSDGKDIGLFLIATITLNVTPGPDTLYVLARSIGQGRMAGVVSVLGGSVGRLIHTFATAFGLSALLMASDAAYGFVKYLGALYLIYLGVRMLLSKGAGEAKTQMTPRSLGVIFRQGVATNVLNPTVALFFVAFLPQFTDSTRGPIAWQIIFLGLIFTLSATLWSLTVALLAGFLGNWLGEHPKFYRTQRWITGSIFIALGARLALA